MQTLENRSEKPRQDRPSGGKTFAFRWHRYNGISRRKIERRSFYTDHNIICFINVKSKITQCLLADLSPEGLALKIRLDNDNCLQYLENGVCLLFKADLLSIPWCQIQIKNFARYRESSAEYLRIGCIFVKSNEDQRPKYWVSEGYEPTAWFEESGRTFAASYIRMRALAFAKNVILFKTSLRNTSIALNRVLTLNIDLAHLGRFTIRGQVRFVECHDDHMSFSIEYEECESAFMFAISEYLLCFAKNVTPRGLIKSGFRFEDFRSAVSLSYVNSKVEFEELLRLRHYVSLLDGRIKKSTDFSQLADKYDAYSRQIACRVGGKIVGAARVIFSQQDITRCEIKDYIDLPNWILAYPFVEFSRLLVHPQYRTGHIYQILIQECARIAINAKVVYAICDCRKFLTSIYEGIGAQRIFEDLVHPLYPNEKMDVVTFDLSKIISGQGSKLDFWEKFISPVLDTQSSSSPEILL